ncbi:MAG: GTP pyrophosphokinase [Parcubacteria group bacterium Licking1014_1]|nr:MAG: GTP pyrophosphokinase [Parcubacteria group bacterium Licking1014_1]
MREINSIRKIIERSSDPKLIADVFEFSKQAYKEKFRASGENYIKHAARVALSLNRMGLDAVTIAAAFLHDIADDMPISSQKIHLHEIEKRFGKEIAYLVEKISELPKIRYSLTININEKKLFTKEKIENLRKMFLALAEDLRVVLIELVSRLDGLNSLRHLPEEKQKLYALETLEIFVPIANRLGLGEIRRQLEDLSFYYLFPEKFKWLEINIKEPFEKRETYLRRFVPRLKKILKSEKVKFLDVNWRAKSYWSACQKLLKRDMDFEKIHDLIAIRIIVKDIQSCYRVLGIIHKNFEPISEEINDYIAKPKPSGYRSLHTTVFCEEEKITEIQIKTEEMHKEAEYGICAHWSYKEKIDLEKEQEKFSWVKEVPTLWKTFKIDFLKRQIFIFTPQGDVIALPKGSTPIDFAYAIHSEIGNHCESAKITGKIVPLSHLLENGDIVEIITNQKRKPSHDWLKFAKTNLAKNHIKKFAEKKESSFKIPIPHFIKKRVLEIAERLQKRKEEKIKIKKEKPKQIYLAGQKGILVHVAKCCNPQPEEEVRAYLSQHRAAVLHKISCSNFKKIAEKFPEKIIDASWK